MKYLFIIEQTMIYDKTEKKYKTSNKILGFDTTIEIVNLNNTELTSEGY